MTKFILPKDLVEFEIPKYLKSLSSLNYKFTNKMFFEKEYIFEKTFDKTKAILECAKNDDIYGLNTIEKYFGKINSCKVLNSILFIAATYGNVLIFDWVMIEKNDILKFNNHDYEYYYIIAMLNNRIKLMERISETTKMNMALKRKYNTMHILTRRNSFETNTKKLLETIKYLFEKNSNLNSIDINIMILKNSFNVGNYNIVKFVMNNLNLDINDVNDIINTKI